MKSFLKKLETDNFKLRFLNFSEIDCWSELDNYTRIKSFILNGAFEISCSKWYKMYIQIVDSLKKAMPLNLDHLLDLSPFIGRCVPFLDHESTGYTKTSFGLFLRVPTAANDVIWYVKSILKIYGFNLSDAYLVVELNPNSASYFSKEIVEQINNDLFKIIKATFVRSDDYYNIAINGIDALNEALQNKTVTVYNNLYLLSEEDYDKYSREAIETQIKRPNNTFSKSELNFAVTWLYYARFCEGDYLNLKHKKTQGSFIRNNEKLIPVTFRTHFYSKEDR